MNQGVPISRFNDKVVIITGAGSGIGAATARRFAVEGAAVVLAGRTRDKLERVAAGLPDPDRVLVHPTDVAEAQQVQTLVDAAIARFGQLDVLINDAGTAIQRRVPEASDEDWRHIMSINVDGLFYCCRAALPHLRNTRGNIVNVSSVSGIGGDWSMAVYNASKGAVTNLTRAMALDHGSEDVRVNAVCPSLTRSDLTASMFDNDALMTKFAERIPMGRAAEPEEVGDVIAFLASDDARFVNGVNLPVDGGLWASNGQPNMG